METNGLSTLFKIGMLISSSGLIGLMVTIIRDLCKKEFDSDTELTVIIFLIIAITGWLLMIVDYSWLT